MSEVVIEASELSKRFRLGARKTYSTLRESLMGLFSARRKPVQNAEFWALKDVSFEVRRGEVLAIIGRNGAGKSTLLKVLSRIVEPTSGSAMIVGRVGALLEVGTGFHPELTGRENVFLNGAILGMSRREIASKFDEIVAFAEVEQFIDTPVKHYSSGMGLRLGFAVAAHLEPEILIVDEVLAVGDASFQKKCLGKMDGVARQGRTVLFVSHNMAAVKSLCSRALILEGGRVIKNGPVNEVVDQYLNGSARPPSEQSWDDATTAPGDSRARLRAVRAWGPGQREQISISEPVTLEVDYEVYEPGTILNVSLSVYSQDNIYVFNATNANDATWYAKPHPVGRYRSQCTIPAHFFNEGRYFATIILAERARHVLAHAQQAIAIDMIDFGEDRGGYFGYWGGVVRPKLDWRTEREELADSA